MALSNKEALAACASPAPDTKVACVLVSSFLLLPLLDKLNVDLAFVRPSRLFVVVANTCEPSSKGRANSAVAPRKSRFLQARS